MIWGFRYRSLVSLLGWVESGYPVSRRWEKIQAKNAGDSWKDEYWTVVLSIPVILCFVPFMVEYIEASFVALSSTPDWYQYLIGAAILSSFGIRVGKIFKR